MLGVLFSRKVKRAAVMHTFRAPPSKYLYTKKWLVSVREFYDADQIVRFESNLDEREFEHSQRILIYVRSAEFPVRSNSAKDDDLAMDGLEPSTSEL